MRIKRLLLPTYALLLALAPLAAEAQDDITVVVDADFTQFTEGTPESPVDFPSYGTGSFTSFFPSWMVSKVAQAGGQVLIKDGGYVRTKSVNLSANDGIIRVSTKVKMTDNYGGIFKISCGYSSANAKSFIITDSLWHDITVVIGGGSSSANVRIEPSLSAGGVLVRNLKVEQSSAFIPSPEAQQPIQADGKSFTARWRSVTGATAYILDVYSYEGSQKEKVYLLENKNVGNVLTYAVTGLDESKTYYYTVRATNGTAISDPSAEIKVVKAIYSLATPANLALTAGTNHIIAHWDAVPDAQYYILALDRILTCPEDMMVDMVDENFDKVTAGSLDQVEFISRSNLDAFTQTKGWSGEDLAQTKGNMVISPFSSTGWLSTPLLNLNGKDDSFTLDCRLAVAAFGSYYTGTAQAALINVAGDTLQVKDININNKEYANYQLTFTQGADSCRIALLYSGDYKLFIDSFKITQLKAKGTKVSTFLTEVSVTDLSAQVEAQRQDNTQISATITAGAETVSIGDIVDIYSDPSAPVVIDYSTLGIAEHASELQSVSVQGRNILLTLSASATVALYNMDGKLLYNATQPEGRSSIIAPDAGIYLLRVETRAHKLIIK